MSFRNFILQLVIISSVLAGKDDLYERLQISRSATLKEIKSAYRREATKWHPDKNTNENAERKFIEITKAYEVLSDPKKRAKYDALGVYDLGDERNPDDFRPYMPLNIFSHFFGEHFFNFGQSQMDENVVVVNFHNYREKILPGSRSTPLLLFGISPVCFLCRKIQPFWSTLANRYSNLGIIFGVANTQDDQALREELNVLHSPSILAVVDKKITYFMRSEITENAIVEFIVQALLDTGPLRTSLLQGLPSNALPAPLITFLKSEADFDTFLKRHFEDSRPRTLLLQAQSRPSLKFCLAAFRALDHYVSGFININLDVVKPILNRFGIANNQESILVFHESPDEPVITHSAFKIPRQILDDIYMQNSRLAVPRILSSSSFLDLCPADGHPPSSAFASAAETKGNSKNEHTGHRHLCLVLLLQNSKNRLKNIAKLDQFRNVLQHIPHALKSSLGLSYRLPTDFYPILSPTYIYIDRQAAWLKNISDSSTCPACLDLSANLDGRLLVLWRITSRILAFKPLLKNETLTPELLKGTLAELVMDSLSVDDYLKSHDVKELHSSILGWTLAYLPKMESCIVDELSAPLWLRIRLKLGRLICSFISYFEGMWTDPWDFFISSGLIFIPLAVLAFYQIFQDFWIEIFLPPQPRMNSTSLRPDSQNNRPNNPSPSINQLDGDSEPRSLVLTPSTYDRLVLALPKGHFTIILCTDTSPLGQRLSLQFYQICRRYRGTSNFELVPACLYLDRYANWLGWALEAATRIPFRPANASGNSNNIALTFNPANCCGTVLAVNGFRRYFHMYHPLLPGSEARSCEKNSDHEIEEADNYILRQRKKPLSKESRRVANFSRLLGLSPLSSSDEDGSESTYESEENETRNDHHSYTRPPLLEHEVLAGLSTWFDRLFEGSLRRHHVTEWPPYLTATSS